MRQTIYLLLFLCFLSLPGCRDNQPGTARLTPVEATTGAPAPTAVDNPTATPVPPTPTTAVTELSTPTLPNTATPGPAGPTATPTWPATVVPPDALARLPVSSGQGATFEELSRAVPPKRNDVDLAVAYRDFTPSDELPAVTEAPLEVGSRQTFYILNYDDHSMQPVELVLRGFGEHAYFWFDTGPGAIEPDPETLATTAAAFDEIYAQNVAAFGQEDLPGIDGDPRIHVVNVSPLVLCDVTLQNAGSCGLAGYFSASDVLPAGVATHSNEREMFVMNAWNFGTAYYLNVLGHEFRHMIEHRYDQGDIDWVAEGSAVLAEELLGYGDSPRARANLFLSAPDQQLNRWTDGNPTPHYGQGYLLNHYLYHRLGPDLYRQFAQSPAAGLAALDEIAADNGLPFSGHSLWLDWLAALAIHDHPAAPAEYQLQNGFDTAASTAVNRFPSEFDTDVHQYAVDYYRLFGDGAVTVQFTGSTLVGVLDTMPASGEWFWYAQRANYSQMRLTRELDLRDVAAATLQYDVYYDIEQGYDFAYVAVSTDGGRRWTGLQTTEMDGLDVADNPGGRAFTDRFYTGRRREWVRESIDLSSYAGQQIQLRFEYVTDPILTFGGLALDNIAVPEIGFYDDAEDPADGWTAEGFSRVTASMPQQWHLQLVTFPGGMPVVEMIPLTADQTASFTVDLGASDDRPILIVAASAPMTLEVAHYRLEFD